MRSVRNKGTPLAAPAFAPFSTLAALSTLSAFAAFSTLAMFAMAPAFAVIAALIMVAVAAVAVRVAAADADERDGGADCAPALELQ